MIVLEGCTVELSDHEDGFTFMVNFPGSNTRTYVLSADTQEDMESWMKVIMIKHSFISFNLLIAYTILLILKHAA